jgi:hypothetical protein
MFPAVWGLLPGGRGKVFPFRSRVGPLVLPGFSTVGAGRIISGLGVRREAVWSRLPGPARGGWHSPRLVIGVLYVRDCRHL